ncbi:MAG: hypothetical protein JXB34_15430 [Bacteroidales bacterium]|nr:hypothetical protein [Bacteroidales bacterium]
MKTFSISLVIVLSMGFYHVIQAQENSYTQQNNFSGEIAIETGTTTISLPELPQFRKSVHGANFQVSLRVENITAFIQGAGSLSVSGLIKGYNLENIEVFSSQAEMSVDIDKFHNVVFVDLSENITETNGNFNVTVKNIQFEITEVSGSLAEHCNLSAIFTVDYGYDVTYNGSNLVSRPDNLSVLVTPGSRNVKFAWEHSFPFSYYQLQVWRVPDMDENSPDIESKSVFPDWNNALSVFVPVEPFKDGEVILSKQSPLSLLEGSGLYIWRVRPVGGYYQNSFADIKNFGQWPFSLDMESYTFSSTNEGKSWFRFSDADSIVNTIHSKIFTENGQTKETTVYADGLQNIKQTQTYIPSVQSTIIVQSEQDFSGRASLTSVPVPVDGQNSSYAENLLRNSQNKVYTASNFDYNSGVPEPASNSGAFGYYAENNDLRIPNSEGFPFIRTLYYNDASGRVKEQSAPGAAFAINSDGSGHTVKYFYGTPSELELTRIFGSDAPDHEKVMKAVVMDQNGVTTTSYSTIEGNTIATCLSLSNSTNLEPLDGKGPGTNVSITELATRSIESDGGFYSSKRLILAQPNTVTVSYSVTKSEIEAGCTKASVDCNFELELSVVDLSTGTVTRLYPLDNDIPFNELPYQGDRKTLPDITVDLPAGSYLVQKRLFAGNPSVSIDETTLRNKIVPVSKLLESWMDKVTCNANALGYYNNLNILRQHFNNGTLNLLANDSRLDAGFPIDASTGWGNFISEYNKLSADEKNSYRLTFFIVNEQGADIPFNGNIIFSETHSLQQIPDYALIQSACCDITFPTKYIPYINFDPETWGYNAAEGIYYPDFEGYARNYLASCFDSSNEDDFYTYYMNGWPEGMFNLMVYRMLTDKYERINTYSGTDIETIDANNRVTTTPCGEQITHNCPEEGTCSEADGSCSAGACYKYQIYDLFNCWQSVLTKLQAELGCSNFDADGYGLGEDGDNKVDKIIDDKQTSDDTPQDEHYDDNFNPKKKFGRRVLKWLAKRAISKQMREESPLAKDMHTQGEGNGLSTTHLVKEFLECAGYKFAKVITPYDPFPLQSDRLNDDSYYYQTNYRVPPHIGELNSKVNTVVYFSNFRNAGYPYIPLTNWQPKQKVLNDDKTELIDSEQLLFPNIKNPLYAFKYFEYSGHARVEYSDFEAGTCFDDPNDCYRSFQSSNVRWVEVDPLTKKPVKIPCCTDTENPGFCYNDFAYPNLDKLSDQQVLNDPRFGNDTQEGRYRRVVRDFTDKGRLVCPYDHEVWSCGEREMFYLALVNYEKNNLRPEDDDTPDEPNNNDNCNEFINEPVSWYSNSDGTLLPRIFLPDEIPVGYTQVTDLSDYAFIERPTPPSALTRLEVEMALKKNHCTEKCNENRDKFEQAVYKALDYSCYEIGGCYSTESPWNIPVSHVEQLVDLVVGQCIEKCNVSSFGCVDVTDHRDLDIGKQLLGAQSVIDDSYADVFIGLAHDPNSDFCSQAPIVPANYTDCNIAPDMQVDFNTDGIADAWRWPVNSTYTIDKYSWHDYTNIQQASLWKVDISLAPMCLERYGTGKPPKFMPASGINTNFVDKNVYETPVSNADANRVKVNNAVVSPAVGKSITIQPLNE